MQKLLKRKQPMKLAEAEQELQNLSDSDFWCDCTIKEGVTGSRRKWTLIALFPSLADNSGQLCPLCHVTEGCHGCPLYVEETKEGCVAGKNNSDIVHSTYESWVKGKASYRSLRTVIRLWRKRMESELSAAGF